MRDKVSSPIFRLQKKLAVFLHALFPHWYLPLYTMIEFTRIPYADARRRAWRQDWIIRGAAIAILIVLVILFWWMLR
jgi:kynurenine 3-monooxygenase